MKEQQFKEGDHVRIRNSNDVVRWLQGEKGRITAVAKMGHTWMYSIRFDRPKRGRISTDRVLEFKLEKS